MNARTPKKETNPRYKEQCQHFCEDNFRCNHCTKVVSCGRGYTASASFGIREKERWFACQRAGTINRVWPDLKTITKETTTLIVALGGFSGWRTDDGIEWFCDEYLPRKKYPNVLCISSFAAPKTASRKLAENIKRTVEKIQKKSGKKPSVILVGKSIGGCKLHHAISDNLRNLSVDLFIGVDVSCSIKRHFDNPRDSLRFPNNVAQIFSFYQNRKGEKQTGHRLIHEKEKWNNDNHINVNEENINCENHNKDNSLQPICPQTGHNDIDNCIPLKKLIKKIILKSIK